MKKIFSLVLVLALSLSFSAIAYAGGDKFLVDLENVVWEEETLELMAQQIYDKCGIAVTYVSTESLEGMTGPELAGEMYARHISYPDGILLLDCREAPNYCMYYSGIALDVLTNDDVKAMMEAYYQGSTYDESVRAYLETADHIFSGKDLPSKDLLLLDDLSDDSVQPAATTAPESGNDELLTFGDVLESAAPATPENVDTPQIPAERQMPLVVDTAGVLGPDTVEKLNSYAQQISDKYACDVAAVFVATSGAKDIQAFADDFYDYNGYGYGSEDSGIMFVVAVQDRSFAITTYGPAAYSFSDYGQLYMDEKYMPYLRNSDWAGAAEAYLRVSEELLEYERVNGRPFDIPQESQSDPRELIPGLILLSLGGGFVFAFIPIGVMKRKMLNVRKQENAANYILPGSFELFHRHDRYLTSHVTRVAKPQEDNTRGGSGGGTTFHVSSSGRSHGGHSGRF